ncbi:MAG TPA: hypothetical protein VF883_09025 [Thermoanaerobaculia bacterium]|jgi:tetratricopeptide (TPR) repeat protein
MKFGIVMLLAATSLIPDLTRFWHETNSRAATSRGRKAFEEKRYAEAAQAFAKAHELAPSARTAFNLGTAQIAAGQRLEGAATLDAVVKDPELRADALYNRGNGALAAKALDHAVRDYTDALRANPRHAAAKRNLEIALTRRRQQQQQQQSQQNQQQQQQGQTPQKPQPAPSQGQQQPKPGQLDLEALLRSVQQQEQDELRRMKARSSSDGRVGW